MDGLDATVEVSILYRHTEHFGLNFKHLADTLRSLQVTRWHIMKHAKDDVSRKVYRYRLSEDQKGHTGRGRKFVPSLTLESLEGKLSTKDIVGNAQTGTSGLGLRKKPPRTLTTRKERRK